MVAAIIALLYFSFTANPTERVVFLVFAGFLAIAEISRVRVRIRQRAKDNDDDTPSPNPEFQ